MTINEAIQLMAQVKGRLNKLVELRKECGTKTSWSGTPERVVEPAYDVKKVDAKVSFLENWIWKVEARIKAVNARTEIGQFDGEDVPVDKLLTPLD